MYTQDEWSRASLSLQELEYIDSLYQLSEALATPDPRLTWTATVFRCAN